MDMKERGTGDGIAILKFCFLSSTKKKKKKGFVLFYNIGANEKEMSKLIHRFFFFIDNCDIHTFKDTRGFMSLWITKEKIASRYFEI